MVNKQTKTVIALLVGVGILFAVFGGQGTPTQPSATSGGVQAGGVVVNAFTPSVDYTVTDTYKANTALSGNRALLTLQGNIRIATQGTAVNANNGESYNIAVWPTSTYYAPEPKSGTVNGVTSVPFQMILIGTSYSTWVDNDPSSATQRNSASAADAIGSGGTSNPKYCIQNNTQFSEFGKGKRGLLIDYNGLVYDEPTLSGGTKDQSTVISNHSRIAGTTATVGFRFDEPAKFGEVKCITAKIQAKSGINPTSTDGNVGLKFVDYYTFINKDGGLSSGYETDTGTDSNSATNQTITHIVS